jgi:hypothetical protein
MPEAYLKMKRAMQKEYGQKKGEKIAAATWNKQHAGTGQTVGRGQHKKGK